MKIAIVGAGISGLTAAYYLADTHDIHVFESAPSVGGHTATIDVNHDGQQLSVDTGFIVFNNWTYPNFIRLMDELDVASHDTEMSFSVRCDITGLEYGGNNLNTLFAQRRNLVKPRFYRMLYDILRFNRESVRDLEAGLISPTMTLSEYLQANGYGEVFVHKYLVPMGCAIWSASTASMMDFPVLFFLRFFKNHGLLSVDNRPQWRVISGGSRSYLEPLTRKFKDRLLCNALIKGVRRQNQKVTLSFSDRADQVFDHVIFACHSDQALSLLSDADHDERADLEKIPYRSNDVVLHFDEQLLPKHRLAWSSWNYWLRSSNQQRAVLTYHMNTLQGLNASRNYCVTLNATEEISESKILGIYRYSHPVFSMSSVQGVAGIKRRNGKRNTWFAGAYMGNGFHEDGVLSAIEIGANHQ